MAHSYNIDTGAWIQDSQEGWVSSKVVAKTVNGHKVHLVFELTGGTRTGEVGLLPLEVECGFCSSYCQTHTTFNYIDTSKGDYSRCTRGE